MPYDLDLKRRLELAGLVVTEVDGWQTRGRDTLNAGGSVHHHTGGRLDGVQPSLGVVINGRSDLPGPLCNVHGPREESYRVNLVAAGRANHAGKGGWKGLSGNASVYGHEEEHTGGPNEPVSELRIDRMARSHAAFAFGRFDASMVCQHREWAPGRKPDFIAKFLDADDFRRRVAVHLRRMANPIEENDMTLIEIIAGQDKGKWHVLVGGCRSYIDDPAELDEWRAAGVPVVRLGEKSWARVAGLGRFKEVPLTALDMPGLRSLPDPQRGWLKATHDAVVSA